MNNLSAENLPFFWATLCLRQFYKSGVRHIVISPGSRSTPLTMAAAAHPGLQKHVILDERSAAFFALGIGKSTGVPAVLVCTSGTAVANYFPAIIEARKSGVPLIAATADRPLELHDTDANQTIDQSNIFGSYPVLFHDMGEPVNAENSYTNLQKLTSEAFQYSVEKAGPVHLNFPFQKPLAPEPEFVRSITEENEKESRKPGSPSSQKDSAYFRFSDDILYEIHECERPLIIIGQLPPNMSPKPVFYLAEWLEAPVLSEQGITRTDYAIQGFEGFLRNPDNAQKLEPDLILRFGRPPASKSLLQALGQWEPKTHICLSYSEKSDRSSLFSTHHINWTDGFFDSNKFPEKSTEWLDKWKSTEGQFQTIRRQEVDKIEQLTDGHVYEHLASVIPDEYFLFFSNSFPVRDRSLFGRFGTQNIFTNRGVSGIDGITSTAMGVAIGTGQPGILFTGDLAFLHDTNALLNHRKLNRPLVVVVINNSGGSIFRMLPIAEHSEHFQSYFETPQSVDISSLVSSYDIPNQQIESLSKLKNFELSGWIKEHPGFSVIECQTNADASMRLRQKLWEVNLWK